MKCPFCRQGSFSVIDSRHNDGDLPIRRRRSCSHCKRRVWTIERLEEVPLKVIKKSDQRREPYDLVKLRRGIEKACYKRPVSPQQIEEVVRKIENELFARYYDEVPARVIGDLAMEYLQDLDQVAYIRFASVYREFQDVTDFVDQVKPILSRRANGSAKRNGSARDSKVKP